MSGGISDYVVKLHESACVGRIECNVDAPKPYYSTMYFALILYISSLFVNEVF